MNIYDSTEYIENPRVGDLQLEVNSQWDFRSRSVCFRDADDGLSRSTISYNLKECIEIVDEKTRHTKWKQAELSKEILEQLKNEGYIINNNLLTAV